MWGSWYEVHLLLKLVIQGITNILGEAATIRRGSTVFIIIIIIIAENLCSS